MSVQQTKRKVHCFCLSFKKSHSIVGQLLALEEIEHHGQILQSTRYQLDIR